MAFETERVVEGRCKTELAGHAGGTVHDPKVIAKAIEELAK